MVSTFVVEIINGVKTKVEYIRYNNGDTIRRVYPTVESIVPSEAEPIQHKEYELYARYLGL